MWQIEEMKCLKSSPRFITSSLHRNYTTHVQTLWGSEPIWSPTYLIRNLFDPEAIWFQTCLNRNISASGSVWLRAIRFRTYLIPILSNFEPIWSYLILNQSDSKPIWFQTYLIPNLSDSKSIWLKTYMIPNLSDSKVIWFQTYLVPNLSDSKPTNTWFQTHLIPVLNLWAVLWIQNNFFSWSRSGSRFRYGSSINFGSGMFIKKNMLEFTLFFLKESSTHIWTADHLNFTKKLFF